MAPRAISLLALAVLALHTGAIWLLVGASQPHARRIAAVRHVPMEVVQIVVQKKPSARSDASLSAPPATKVPPSAARRGRPAQDNNAATHSRPTPAPDAEPPRPTSAITTPLILNSAAMQRALRDEARRRTFAEQAAQQLGTGVASSFDARFSASVASAARGDCMRGQFQGSNMGLLSLPMLALAATRGECAR